MNKLTKNYYFSRFIEGYKKENMYPSKVEATFYVGCPGSFGCGSDFRKSFALELDDEDIEYLRKKYILTEINYKKQELEEALEKVECLRRQINSINNER